MCSIFPKPGIINIQESKVSVAWLKFFNMCVSINSELCMQGVAKRELIGTNGVKFVHTLCLREKSTNLNMADESNHRDGFYDRFCTLISDTVVNHVISSRVPVYKRDSREIWPNTKEIRLFRIFPTYGHVRIYKLSLISSPTEPIDLSFEMRVFSRPCL